MGRSESPARRRRDSSSSSNSSADGAPAKKRRSASPANRRDLSPPAKFKAQRRSRSRSAEGRNVRRRDDRDLDRTRERRGRESPNRRNSQSPRRRDTRDRRDDRSRPSPPPRGRDSPRRDRGRDRSAERFERRDDDRRRREDGRGRDDNRDGYGRKDPKREVKEEPGSPPRESQIMKGRDSRSNQNERPKWGTREMWEADEKKREEKNAPPVEKEKVNMGTSGLLAADTNTFNGVVIKYNEPPDAKKPNIRWRLYQFKGDETLDTLYIHRQSAYLVADIPVDHPSCSRQHAAIQYRSMFFEKADGTRARRIRPYIIDLASANGTFLNGTKIDPQRYHELKEKDVLKFGFSSREYVILTENALEHEGKEEEKSGSSSSDDSEDEEEQ